MRNFWTWDVWKNSKELAINIYQITGSFPKEELFGLTSQIRRAAISISANIAEGAGRSTDKDFKHFLSISTGSAFELETLIIIAAEIDLIDNQSSTVILDKIDHIQRQLNNFMKKL